MTDTDSFKLPSLDAYHKWLGIPPSEQPPNHYRLLGLTLFESDPEAINQAADRQTAHVRGFQTGPYSNQSQSLLQEIADARQCLLDSDKRNTYDMKLRGRTRADRGSTISRPLPRLAKSLGNYVLTKKIGEGGMGEVYLGRHQHLDRLVAIKVLPPTNKAKALQRFRREIKILASLSHPNIVAAHDADQQDGIHFLVMEYVDGQDLSTFIKQNGPVSPEVAVDYIRQAAQGLAYAHENGIIHRDIKPSNLLVDKRGTIKILDLGLARLNDGDDELTHTGSILGTVDYMAPEQAISTKDADHRADIYSLGCTFYALLVGKPTYVGDTAINKIVAHREQPIPSLRKMRRDISPKLESVFKKMVAKRPDERYQSMNDLLTDLSDPEIFEVHPSRSSGSVAVMEPRRLASTSRALPRAVPMPELPPEMFMNPAFTEPVLLAKPAPKGLNPYIPHLVASAAIFLAALLAFGVILKIRTKDGTLVISVNEPGATVEVLDSEGKVQITRENQPKGEITIAVDPGKHRLRVEKQGFQLYTDNFSIDSGDTETINARLLPLEPQQTAPSPVRSVAPTVGPTVAPMPVAAKPIPAPIAETTKDRQIAVELLSRGAKLTVATQGEQHVLVNVGELPSMPFSILVVDLTKSPNGSLKFAKELKSLEAIVCVGAAVGDDDLKDLAEVTTLHGLNLGYTNVTDEGLQHLSKLTELHGLNLTKCNITTTGLQRLAELKSISGLELAGTKVQDLSVLANFPNLVYLTLGETSITDADFQMLKACSKLATVYIDGTSISESAVNDLKQALPNCNVRRTL